MGIESELLRTLNSINRTLEKFNNSSASAVGGNASKDGKYTSSEKIDTADVNKSMDELSKAAKNASNRLNKGMDDAVKEFSDGFSHVVKRAGRSIASTFGPGISGKIQNSIDDLDKTFKNSSVLFRDSISDFINDSLSGNKINKKSFLNSSEEVNQSFKALNDIINKSTSNMKISQGDIKDFNSVLKDLEENGIDLKSVFNDAGKDLNTFRKIMLDGAEINLDDHLIKQLNLKKVNDVINKSGGQFAASVLAINNTIDKELGKSVKNLISKADNLGDDLMKSLRVTGAFAVHDQVNSLFAVVEDGFRNADMMDLTMNAVDFGQSQQEFSKNMKQMRTSLRVFGDNANALKVAGGDAFETLHNEIRNRFALIGADNNKFAKEGFETFINLGIKPTIGGMNSYMNTLQSMEAMGNESASELNSMFVELSKDKSFKRYFLSVNKGQMTMTTLAKTMRGLQKATGLSITEIMNFQKKLGEQQGHKAVNRQVEGAFAGRLAGELGFGDKQIALLTKFTKSPNSLSAEETESVGLLQTEMALRLEKAIIGMQKTGDIGGETRLEILMGNAGVLGERNAGVLSAERSGKKSAAQKFSDAIIQESSKEMGTFTKGLRIATEALKGLAQSPIGKMTGGILGIMGTLLPDILGGVVAGSIAKNGIKGAITGVFSAMKKGIVSQAGFFTKALRKLPWVAAAVAVGNGIKGAFEAKDGGRVDGFVKGLGDGVGMFFGGIIDSVLGTNTTEFISTHATKIFTGVTDFFDVIGTSIGESAGWAVSKVTGVFSTIDSALSGAATWTVESIAGGIDMFSNAVSSIGGFFGDISDSVGLWIDGVGNTIDKTVDDALGMVDDITSNIGGILDDAGNFITDGFTSGWDAITSFFGDDEEPHKTAFEKREQELLAAKGREIANEKLTELVAHMERMTKEATTANVQSKEQHAENVLINKGNTTHASHDARIATTLLKSGV